MDRSVPSGRGRRRCAAALGSVHGHGAIRARVPAAGEKGGGERAGGRGERLYAPRGARERGRGGGGHGSKALVAVVLPLSPQEEEGGVRPTGGSPLSGISPFPIFRNSCIVLYLIEAFKHFQKFCKNSSGFQLTCRAYPKIGVAI